MVIRNQPCRNRARQRGALVTELIVALAILATVMIPLGFAFDQERRTCRRLYYRAAAMEMIDGEMEILVAGEWRAFKPGAQDYPLRAVTASNLPPGRCVLTVGDQRLRLEWRPAKLGQSHPVIREVRIP